MVRNRLEEMPLSGLFRLSLPIPESALLLDAALFTRAIAEVETPLSGRFLLLPKKLRSADRGLLLRLSSRFSDLADFGAGGGLEGSNVLTALLLDPLPMFGNTKWALWSKWTKFYCWENIKIKLVCCRPVAKICASMAIRQRLSRLSREACGVLSGASYI